MAGPSHLARGKSARRIPRWLKVVGIAKVVMVVLMALVLHLNSDDGPARHFGLPPTVSR